jgi:sugar diacid utilization regulator
MCNLEDPVDEIQEFEYLVENVEVEEGKADNNNEEEVFDFITVKIKTYTAPELKDVCRALSLSTSGNKTVIFTQIWDSSNPLIEQIDDESFVYKKKKEVVVANLSLPWWVVLNPDPAPKIDGIDMLCGA